MGCLETTLESMEKMIGKEHARLFFSVCLSLSIKSKPLPNTQNNNNKT